MPVLEKGSLTMKIPKIFVLEKDLDEKVQELAQEVYNQNINLEERAFLEERLQEGYLTELKEKREKWRTGNHLNMPGTDKISPKRLVFNATMMVLSMVGTLYLFEGISDYLPNYVMIPSFFASMVGFPMITYKTIAEVMIRCDTWKKYKKR